MSSSKSNLKKSVLGFFLATMCMMYPQQIGGFVAKGLGLFSDICVKIFTGPLLKAIGI